MVVMSSLHPPRHSTNPVEEEYPHDTNVSIAVDANVRVDVVVGCVVVVVWFGGWVVGDGWWRGVRFVHS